MPVSLINSPITKEGVIPLLHSPDEKFEVTNFVGNLWPRKHVTIIASTAGTGKTWLIIHVAACLSRGKPSVLNASDEKIESPYRILFFVGETGISLMLERFSELEDFVNTANISLVSAFEIAKAGYNTFLDVDVAIYNAICNSFKPDLIVFDSLMSFRGDDENSPHNTATVMKRLQALAEIHNAAVLVTHHLRKKNQKHPERERDQDDVIGSSVLTRFASTVYLLERSGAVLKLRPVKSWWKYRGETTYVFTEINELASFRRSHSEIGLKIEIAQEYIRQFDENAALTVESVMHGSGVGRNTALEALKSECGKPQLMAGKYVYFRKGTA